jgi:NADH:ubiquinone oxidoreductase subunit F (NADH-binding)
MLMDRLKTDQEERSARIDALFHQSQMMAKTALCPLGQSPVLPIESAVRFFGDELADPQPKTLGWHP